MLGTSVGAVYTAKSRVLARIRAEGNTKVFRTTTMLPQSFASRLRWQYNRNVNLSMPHFAHLVIPFSGAIKMAA